jgi:hypothetical protein
MPLIVVNFGVQMGLIEHASGLNHHVALKEQN